MSKKISIIIICIIIVISLAISIYLPNREKIKEETEDTSINYSVIEKDGKYGVAQNGDTIIEPQYDKIIIPNQHRAVFMCQKDENQKFVNQENQEIFKKYNDVKLIEIYNEKYGKNMLTYQENGKMGLVGLNEKKITDAKYDEIFNLGYKDGEVVVKENGKYGILDEKGKTKIKIEYDSILMDEYYTEEQQYKKAGYVVQLITSDGYRYGYYDCDGVQVLTEDYNQITRLTQVKSNDIYLIAAQNGQYGVFINSTKIINTQYQSIEYNPDIEIFVVERTEKYGAINLKGTEILKTEYTELQINGIYIYTIKDEEKKVWDANGKEVDINFDTTIQKINSEYFIKSEQGYYSILNSKMEQISKQTYRYLEFIYNNYFIATNEQDKSGIIDTQENVIIDFKYDEVQRVKETLVVQGINFSTNETKILFDEYGRIVTD